MSTVPLALAPLNTALIPPEDPAMLTGSSTATLTPGIGSSAEETPLSILESQLWGPSAPGSSGSSLNPFKAASRSSGSASLFGGWLGARGVVLILGLMLIAAGLFSLNPVKEKIILAGKAAAAAA